jgi:Protein kinase domain
VKFLTSTAEAFEEDALLRNARTLAKLNHPNLVTAHSAAFLRHPENGLLAPALIMELLSGEPLQQWFAVQRNREQVLRVATDLFLGIRAIHDGGLYHGDLHAENVMVLADGHTKVIDWRYQDTFLAASTASQADLIRADERQAIHLVTSMFDKQGLRKECLQLGSARDLASARAMVEQFRAANPERLPRQRKRFLAMGALLIVLGGTVAIIKNRIAEGPSPFATVVPQTHSPGLELTIWNEGDEPLTGVAVKIICHSCTPITSEPEINVGTIPAHGFRELKSSFSPQLGSDGIASYMLLISETKGQTVESLQFRPGRNALPWAFQYQVTRQIPRDNGDGTTTTKSELLKQAAWSDDLGGGRPTK